MATDKTLVCAALVMFFHLANGKCPDIKPGTMGICVEECSTNADCPEEHEECCSNDCGFVCTDTRCKMGQPLRNSSSNVPLFCGEGPTHANCPHMFHCVMQPEDKMAAVCCECSGDSCDNVDPCMGYKCEDDEMCQAKVVTCITAPCPPVAECVACTNNTMCPCKDNDCEEDEECLLVPDECDSKPCPMKAQCRNMVCQKPMEKGTCEAIEKRWFFDWTKKDCVEFDYGGCGGNENNFKDKDECVEECTVRDASLATMNVASHLVNILVTITCAWRVFGPC